MQDFKDVQGDSAVGRRTLPILYPEASRIFTFACMVSWSALFAYRYGEECPAVAYGMTGLGILIAARLLLDRTRKGDCTSYVLYNVSLLSYYFVHLYADVLVPLFPMHGTTFRSTRSGFCSCTRSHSSESVRFALVFEHGESHA